MALRKARTAALFRKESGELGKKTLPGQPVGGLGRCWYPATHCIFVGALEGR